MEGIQNDDAARTLHGMRCPKEAGVWKLSHFGFEDLRLPGKHPAEYTVPGTDAKLILDLTTGQFRVAQ